MKVETDIFLLFSSGWRHIRLIKVDRYFLTLSSGCRPIKLMKVKTDIFLPCLQIGDLLDL